jgi:hypothetical protein
MLPSIALSVVVAILAVFALSLWLEVRNQGKWWSERFEQAQREASLLENRAFDVELRLKAVEVKSSSNAGSLASQATLIDSVNSLTQLTVSSTADIKVEFSQAFDNLEQRLETLEAKADIPKPRIRSRLPFSQLKGFVKTEPSRPEPNRWNPDGSRVGEEATQ